MSEKEDTVTAEEVDRALTSAILQVDAAHTAMWAAVADGLLLQGKPDDADFLLALLSHATTKVTPDKDGGFYRAITRNAMKSIAQFKYGENIPEEVRRVVSGEEPVKTIIRHGEVLAGGPR